MSEFESTINLTENDPPKLESRIVAQRGLKNRALERASKAKPGKEKDQELKRAKEHEANMNRLLDHRPDGEPRDIKYLAIAEEEIANELREALDKGMAVEVN